MHGRRGARVGRLASLTLASGVLSAAAVASAQQAGRVVELVRPSAGDVYAAGETVRVRAPIDGDLVAAGARIDVDATVTGDAILAGEVVDVSAPIGDDLRALGQDVRVGADVQGHVVAAGEDVTIEAGRRVGDFAWLAGSRVVVDGDVGGLRAAGGSVTIAGTVRGDARVDAPAIRLAPGAVVLGDLQWSGDRAPRVDGSARVEGRVVRVPAAVTGQPTSPLWMALFWITSLVVAVVLLVLTTPRASATLAATARQTTWRVLGAGVLLLVLTPIVVVLALSTGVLWIAGVVLLAAYALAVTAGLLYGVQSFGDVALAAARRERGTPTQAQRVGAGALAAAVVGAVTFVPVLGALVLLLAILVGLGSTGVALWRVRRGGPPGAPVIGTPPARPVVGSAAPT